MRWSHAQDESEITYLLERLQKLEDETTSESTWRDVCESWMALLQLRAKIEVERGQIVLECMLADPTGQATFDGGKTLVVAK